MVETVTLLHSLGFTIHAKKSFLVHIQTTEVLEFIIHSRKAQTAIFKVSQYGFRSIRWSHSSDVASVA